MRDNGIKVKQERFRLGIRKNLFPREDSEAVGQAAREVVRSPSLEIFKLQLNKALSSLG